MNRLKNWVKNLTTDKELNCFCTIRLNKHFHVNEKAKKNVLITLFIPLFSSLLILLPSKISKGCGPGDFSFKGYSFLLNDLAQQDDPYAPYFLKFDHFYENYQQNSQVQTDENLAEWQEIFCQLANIKDIEQIIYNTSVEDLETIKTAVKSKNYPLPARLNRNTFARHLERHECDETIGYLIYAKTCEPHVTNQSG